MTSQISSHHRESFALHETPMVMASLVGVRSFRVENGVLTSPVKRHIFTSSTQSASCAESDHDPGSLECSCGFYAWNEDTYLRDLDEFSSDIDAVVRGFGHATVGSRGWRSQHLQIMSLIRPRMVKGAPGRRLVTAALSNVLRMTAIFSEFLSAIALLTLLPLVCLMLVSAALFASGNGVPTALRSAVSAWFIIPVVAASFAFLMSAPLTRIGMDMKRRSDKKNLSESDIEKLRQNYPDVTWYDSIEEALIAHGQS